MKNGNICASTGILEREQEQSVVYGSVDFGKTVVTSDKYKELVSAAAVGTGAPGRGGPMY